MVGRLDLPTFRARQLRLVSMVQPTLTIDIFPIAYPWIHYNGKHEERLSFIGGIITCTTIVCRGIAVSTFCLGGLVASFCTSFFMTRFGRVRTIMYTNIGWIIGSILMAFSVSPVMFAVGRFCSGASCGMNSVATPTYNGEIATIQGRGTMGTLNQ